jgi:hypothetical protein
MSNTEFFNPFEGDIGDYEIKRWLDQFEKTEQPLIIKLLEGFKYYSLKKVNIFLKKLWTMIFKDLKTPIDNVWFVPVGCVAKSSSAISYFFKKVNDLDIDKFISINEINSIKIDSEATIVFLDDYIGSGNQASMFWSSKIKEKYIYKSCNSLFYGVLVGLNEGIQKVETNTNFKVKAIDILNEGDLPFSEKSKIFNNGKEKEEIKKIIKKYGEKFFPKYPFGYNSLGTLIGFFYSTPNSTFPIFWSTENAWKPLLPPGESLNDAYA